MSIAIDSEMMMITRTMMIATHYQIVAFRRNTRIFLSSLFHEKEKNTTLFHVDIFLKPICRQCLYIIV